jgi:hypothetical protein
MPALVLETDEQRRRHASAEIRRANRLKLKHEIQARRDQHPV